MADLERWLETAQRRLEEQIIEGDHSGLPSTLHLRRRGKLIASVACPYPRLLVLNMAAPAAAGFGADELIFVADAYGSRQSTNPEGEPWSVGEMQRRAHEPAVRSILTEALKVYRAVPGTPPVLRLVEYQVKRGRVEWSKPGEGEPFGLFARVLRHAVEDVEPALKRMVARGLDPARHGLSEEEGELHRHLGTVRALHVAAALHGESVSIALAVPKDARSRKIAEKSLRRAGMKVKYL